MKDHKVHMVKEIRIKVVLLQQVNLMIEQTAQ